MTLGPRLWPCRSPPFTRTVFAYPQFGDHFGVLL
jgi:hypothetical protein